MVSKVSVLQHKQPNYPVAKKRQLKNHGKLCNNKKALDWSLSLLNTPGYQKNSVLLDSNIRQLFNIIKFKKTDCYNYSLLSGCRSLKVPFN
jgi:hypothetical protein